MRLHTTAHLLAAVMHNKANALITGNQIETDKIFFNIDAFTITSNPDSRLHSLKLVLLTVVFEEEIKAKDKK